ncbi:TPA: hypothetical protein HA231_03345 [Candidatus Woesearchaeota archaeon]|nr:hypothetical protein [Candidatus Woesearchaeota archaeon]
MKRKVIQIAGSTQLVSLPRKWAKKHNLMRGQEIDVVEDGERIVVSVDSSPPFEAAEVNASNLGAMIPRCISAFYKRGIDSLKVNHDNSSVVGTLHSALAKDTVGFEMLEQGENYCLIKHVGGVPSEFGAVLRRIFLLLNTMSDECISAFEKENYGLLKNLAFLEEANNRFTTTCMRYLNKLGAPEEFCKIGPLYLIIESLEQLGDQYKYICQHFSKIEKERTKLRKDVLELFKRANQLVPLYAEIFYKFDPGRVVLIRETRNSVVADAHTLIKKEPNYAEFWLVHHSIVLAQQVFGMVDALLVLKL